MAVVRLDVDGGVGTIRLDRPPMNAIDAEVTAELGRVVRAVEADPGVRAVVVYGGPKIFAAGADVKAMTPKAYHEIVPWITDLTETLDRLARLPVPTVAAVTGYALGGGLELALCADFRVLAENAKVGLPEILLGIIPGAGGTQRLPRLVGPAKAKDLIFSGRQVRAEEALSLGIADHVVAPEDVHTEAVRLAKRFVDGPAHALRVAKRAIDDGASLSLADGLRLESALFTGLFGSEDRRIGMESFLERGPGKADFVGR